ncbi:hypothetical protein GCM10023192_80950 [Amycolatopsis samaneae]
MQPQQQYAELMKRPSLEEISKKYEELRGKIQSRLTSELGISGWEDKHDGRQSGCSNEFPDVNSRDVARNFLSFITAPSSIPAERWPAAVGIISQVGGEFGFNQQGVRVDRPPHFEFELKDQYQAQLSLSTEKTTVLSVETGCHLTAAAKQRGTPQ